MPSSSPYLSGSPIHFSLISIALFFVYLQSEIAWLGYCNIATLTDFKSVSGNTFNQRRYDRRNDYATPSIIPSNFTYIIDFIYYF